MINCRKTKSQIDRLIQKKLSIPVFVQLIISQYEKGREVKKSSNSQSSKDRCEGTDSEASRSTINMIILPD